MNLIRLFLRHSRLHLVLAVLTGILSGASAAGLIALIDTMLSRDKLLVDTLVWFFVSLCLLRLITSLVSQVLLIRLAQNAILNLRMLLSRRILASPLRHLEEIGTHRLLATLSEDVRIISDTALTVPFFLVNITILVSCLVYLFWLSPTVFLLGFSFLLLGICSYQLPLKKAWFLLKLAREQEDRLFNHFRALTEGVKELKLHSQKRQAFLSEDLQTTSLHYRRHNVFGNTVFAAAASWGQVLFFVAIGLLIFVLPALKNINVPIISGYTLTIIYMISPLEQIMAMLPQLSRATVALQKIESLGLSLAIYSCEGISTTEIETKNSSKCLALVGVTHTYYQERGEKNFTLGPIDLTFHPGELVFIVGGNGSGKSTLAKLIAGLYTPETGKIYLDGQLIDRQNREWYRQQFSAVFSDFYLFDRLLGYQSPDLDHQIRDYLVKLQLDHKVRVKDGVFSTTALSQGQRKRLALLSAYLEDRPIYLFDEWASDQDPLFKKIFYTQLLPELKSRGKIVLAISHDDRYFELADRILKLEFGKVLDDKLRCSS